MRIPKPESEYPSVNTEFFFRNVAGELAAHEWGCYTCENIFKYGIWLDKDLAKEAIEKINSVLEIKHD